MSSVIKAHTNKFKWLASAIDDKDYMDSSSLTRYIVVIDGDAIATNGAVVHMLPTPELEDGAYKLEGLKLTKVHGVNVSAKYNPKKTVSALVSSYRGYLSTKTLQDFKPAVLGKTLKARGSKCRFNYEYLTRATNHNERNAFELMQYKNENFVFGVNEFGTFFVLGMKPANLRERLKLSILMLAMIYCKTCDRLFGCTTNTKGKNS